MVAKMLTIRIFESRIVLHLLVHIVLNLDEEFENLSVINKYTTWMKHWHDCSKAMIILLILKTNK